MNVKIASVPKGNKFAVHELPMTAAEKFAGLLIGTAVADSLGLPREGLSPKRAHSIFGGAPL